MECTPDPAIPPGRGKPGKEMTPEEANGFRLLGHCDFGGRNKGDVMQFLVKDDFILCGHVGMSGAGTSVIDASNPRKPKVVNQIPRPAQHAQQQAPDRGRHHGREQRAVRRTRPPISNPSRRASTSTTYRACPNSARWAISIQEVAGCTGSGSATGATPS